MATSPNSDEIIKDLIWKLFEKYYEEIKHHRKCQQFEDYIHVLVNSDLSNEDKIEHYCYVLNRLLKLVRKEKKLYKSITIIRGPRDASIDWSGFVEDEECNGPEDEQSIIREENFHEWWENREWREVQL